MSLIYTCKYVIKGKPAELAEFAENHINNRGRFDLNSLGIDYPEYFDDENPYGPRLIMRYGITELNIWLTVVKRSAFKRQFVEDDIFEAIKERYPNLEVHYGYIIDGMEGFFHFPWGVVRAEEENLERFLVDYEFKPIEYFNKLVLEGDSGDLTEFIENELEYGKLKSHMWGGNDFRLVSIENRIEIYFEEINHNTKMKTYDSILSKYPQLHIKMYTLSIKKFAFEIHEKGKEKIEIGMYTYDDYMKLMDEYNFFERFPSRSGYWVDFAFDTLVFKACERYRFYNEIYWGLSLKMYRLKAKSDLHLYYC